MNILPTKPKATPKTPVSNGKRRSIQDDFSKFKPLNSDSLKKFSTMRDSNEINGEPVNKSGRKNRHPSTDDSDEDLDAEDTVVIKAEHANERDIDAMLSPEDAKRQGELAEGVQKIRVCASTSPILAIYSFLLQLIESHISGSLMLYPAETATLQRRHHSCIPRTSE